VCASPPRTPYDEPAAQAERRRAGKHTKRVVVR
jgi:hypothetical protein